MQNTNDNTHAVYLMNKTTALSTTEATRKERKMLREWAVSGRRDYGRNSVREYCLRYAAK